jgi:TolA-binding protein
VLLAVCSVVVFAAGFSGCNGKTMPAQPRVAPVAVVPAAAGAVSVVGMSDPPRLIVTAEPLPTTNPVMPPVSKALVSLEQIASLTQQVTDLKQQVQTQGEQENRYEDRIQALQESASREDEQLRQLSDQRKVQDTHVGALEASRRQRAAWFERAGQALAQADAILMTGSPEVGNLFLAARGYLQSATEAATSFGNALEAADGVQALDGVSAAERFLANSDLAEARGSIAAAIQAIVNGRATAQSYAAPVAGP